MTSTRPNGLNFRAPRVLFWTALFLRLAVVLVGHTYRIRVDQEHFNFGFEAGRIARSLVHGQGYANPFNGSSGPTAWLPPLYPLLIALAFKLFGVYTNTAALFLLACNSVFSAATAPGIYELAARCFDARGLARRGSKYAAPVALWSGWIWAAYPAFLQYAIHWIWEMSLTTFLFTWTLVLALRLRGVGEPDEARLERQARWGLWAGFGLLWGMIALSNASLLLVLPASIVWILWPVRAYGAALKVGVVGAALACVVFAATLTPWVVRNERTLHALVLTRSNLGIELYESTLDAYNGMPWGTTLPLSPNDPVFLTYVRLGEIRFAHLRGQEAEQRILARPGVFARRTVNRFFFFWDGTPHPPDRHPAQEYLRQLSYSFLSVCGVLGLLLMLKERVPGAGLFAMIFLLAPIPYYLVTVQPRFRHPMEPLIAILGVYLFRSAQTHTMRAEQPREG